MALQHTGRPLEGKVAFVAVSGCDIGQALAAGLVEQGASVALLSDMPGSGDISGVKQVQAKFDSRAAAEAAFATAKAALGPADMMVHSATSPVALEAADLSSLSEQQITAACDATMKSTMYCFQASFAQMSERGGAIVVVGPSLSLVGAAGLVPLSTALEGQRSLVKTAARQWGARRITVNWVGVAAEKYSAKLTGKGPPVPELGPPPPALGRMPDIRGEVVPAIAFFGSAAGSSVTGMTMNIDGGDWMVP